MKLQTYCKSCQKAFVIKSNAGTRPELEDELGGYFNKQCPHCLKNNEYHVNNVFASPSDTVKLFGYIFGGLIMIIGLTGLIWMNGFITLGGIVIGGLVIYLTSGNAPTSTIRAFNSYKIQRNKRK
jgi:predicted lipid-binding transport protein (Tim44 family)